MCDCTFLAFGDEVHQLKIVQHFSKHCSWVVQSENVRIGCFWLAFVWQAVSRWRAGFEGADWHCFTPLIRTIKSSPIASFI
jgi:hypothetical protein